MKTKYQIHKERMEVLNELLNDAADSPNIHKNSYVYPILKEIAKDYDETFILNVLSDLLIMNNLNMNKMEKNELFDRFIHQFAESTFTLTKEQRRNLITNVIMANFKCAPGFDEKQCKEITDGIVELVEKELEPICFEAVVASNNSAGIGIKYKLPYSAKDGFMYISSNDILHVGDKCMITIKKI